MSKWNEWVDIEKSLSYKGCGVYRIRLSDSKDKPIEIARFLDKDKDGILQIGKSTNIQKRLRYFRQAMKGKEYKHAEGKRMNLIKEFTKFKEKCDDCKIQYSFMKVQNKNDTKEEEIKEERLLKCYFKKFGEVPPLNHNLPKKYDIDMGSLNCD